MECVMNMKAISEKLTNAKTLLKLEVKDIPKIAERKPLTPEQKKSLYGRNTSF